MNLPEEILDKILSHLPSDNGQSLRSCSLVSNPWLDPSRRLLFARICIQQHNYRSWLKEISPANTGLLRHAHSLTYTSYGMPDSDRCVHALRDYLPSFHQLKTLQFNALNVEPTIPEHLTLFSTFQHTLSLLYLSGVSITWSSFVALLGYFPHLRDLYISGPSLRVDERPVPQIPHPLRGKLCISLSDEGVKPFTDRFCHEHANSSLISLRFAKRFVT